MVEVEVLLLEEEEVVVHPQVVEVVADHVNLEVVEGVGVHHLVGVVVVAETHHLLMEEVVVVEELLVQEVVGVVEAHLLSKVVQEEVEVVGLKQCLHSLDKSVFQSCVSCTLLSTLHPLT